MRGGKRRKAGRPKGSANKKTLLWNEFGEKLMSQGTARAQKILDKSDDATFMIYFLKLAEFFRPKARQSMDVTFANPDVRDLIKMNDQELDEFIKRFESEQQTSSDDGKDD